MYTTYSQEQLLEGQPQVRQRRPGAWPPRPPRPPTVRRRCVTFCQIRMLQNLNMFTICSLDILFL